jgi:hypothetical protein
MLKAKSEPAVSRGIAIHPIEIAVFLNVAISGLRRGSMAVCGYITLGKYDLSRCRKFSAPVHCMLAKKGMKRGLLGRNDVHMHRACRMERWKGRAGQALAGLLVELAHGRAA